MATHARLRRSVPAPATALSRLAACLGQYGDGAAATKLALLHALEGAPQRSAAQVAGLHEALCFLYAYPDTPEVFAAVERLLRVFADRADLTRHRRALENSGIAGTDIVYPFAASTARWLADAWGNRLTVAWEAAPEAALETRLPLLTLWAERAVFDEPPLDMRAWIDALRGPDTDATFLIRRSKASTGTTLLGDQLYDELGLTLRLGPGPDTPARTRARVARHPLTCQERPLRTGRPDLRSVVLEPPKAVRDVPRREAVRLIDLARAAMVTRKRDLYSFAAAEPADVTMIDCGDGLEFACYGVRPDQRLLLDAVYSFLMLRNGVPVGYALASALWRSSELAYNVFDTYRGGEAAWIYGRLLAIMRARFGVETFTIYPYQLGHDNDEGLQSGAWWFYYKLGFRPKDPDVHALAEREAARVARRRGYRTGLATLKRLVRANLFLHLGPERSDVIGAIPTDRIALAATALVRDRCGADRERATRVLADEAAEKLGAGAWRRWPAGERLAWERWAPLLALLGDTGAWPGDERAALVATVRAKGGPRESDYVARFDAHPRLPAAVARLGR